MAPDRRRRRGLTALSAAIDLAALAPILRDLGLAPPVASVELAGGGSPVFRLDLANGSSVVLKTYRDLLQKAPLKEAYAARLLDGLDLPVTRYLALDETRTRLPFRFAITNHLPGVTVGSLAGEPDVADLYRQMGALLRKLHAVPMAAYGHFDETGIVAPVATNQQFLREQAAHAFGQFRHFGGDTALARQLEGIVAPRTHQVGHSRGAVFAHDDFHPDNVLAERGTDGQLKLTGLIDFGNARAADAGWDLAKALFCCEHDAPGSTAPLREGYGPIDHPDPDGALFLYTLLHRVIMWWWLRHVGIIPDGERHPLIADLEQMADEAACRLSTG